jgi:hypothetical protein
VPAEVLNADGSLPAAHQLTPYGIGRESVVPSVVGSSNASLLFRVSSNGKTSSSQTVSTDLPCSEPSTRRKGDAAELSFQAAGGSVQNSLPLQPSASTAQIGLDQATASPAAAGTFPGWPGLWTGLLAGRHQSLATAAMSGFGGIYSMFYPQLLTPTAPPSDVNWMPSITGTGGFSDWATTSKIPADKKTILDYPKAIGFRDFCNTAVNTGRKMSPPYLTSVGTASPMPAEQPHDHSETDNTFSFETEKNNMNNMQMRLSSLSTPHKFGARDAISDRTSSGAATPPTGNHKPGHKAAAADDSRYRLDDSVRVTKTEATSTTTEMTAEIDVIDVDDVPIDLTLNSRVSDKFNNHSAVYQSTLIRPSPVNKIDDDGSIPTSAKRRRDETDFVVVDDVTDELKCLQRSVSTLVGRDDRTTADEENVKSPGCCWKSQNADWFAVRRPKSPADWRQLPATRRFADSVSLQPMDFSGRETGSACGSRKLATPRKTLTPPSSDNLTLTIQPVARRLDTGFDGDVDRRDRRADADEMKSNCRKTASWPSSSNRITSHLIDDIRRQETTAEKPFESHDVIGSATANNGCRKSADVWPSAKTHFDSGLLWEEQRCGLNVYGTDDDGKVKVAASRRGRGDMTMTPMNKSKFECPCGIFYAHRDTYAMHMAFHYSASEPFRCRLCNRSYPGAVEFYCHMLRYPHDVTSRALATLLSMPLPDALQVARVD